MTLGNRDFTFNADNKQINIIWNGVSVGSYFYDGEGKRVKKVVGNETTVFVYSSGKLVAEYSTAAPPEIGHINYTTTDHLGSPRVITNEFGQVQSRRDFMPFGEDLNIGVGNRTSGQKYSAPGDQVRQKFTGYQKDEETKLDFAEARMYENRHARFTAVDPLLASGKSANPQSFNRYIYVGNNPLLLVDRNGLIWGKSEDGRVRWFGKKLGTGFSEFRPDNWEYIGKNNKIIRLDPNSRKFTERDVPLTPGAVDNPIPSFLGGFRQSAYGAGTGTAKGFGNLGIGIANLLTDGATGGIWRSMAGYNNPFEIERFKYNSTAEYNFGVGTEVGITVGSIVVGGVFTGKPISLSVVPESSAARAPTFWSRSNFEGTRVYHRSDIFDPNLISKWSEGGAEVFGTNVQRMATGRAPIGSDGNSVVLHHMLQTNKSPLAEMTSTFHRTNSRIIHINPNSFGSGINRPAFDAFRSRYWAERASSFR